ncbi:MAG: FeoB-associated Cys-rich membrane protein [Clostridia bacterium]|nr:FeoB-associated Cys-rich membrane protein [Clostridia bacterium]
MENYIIIAALVVVIGLAAWYVYKQKKSGKTCIGCPYSDSCSSKENGCCNDR